MADPVELELLQALKRLPEDKRLTLQLAYQRQHKDRGTALLLQCLSIFALPGIGRIYIGDVGIGVAQFLVSYATCGLGWLWPLVDILLIGAAADQVNRIALERARLAVE